MRQFWISGSLALSLILTGCSETGAPRGEPYFEKPASQEARDVLGEVDPSELPASQRAALAYAHAVTAAALFRAGDDAGGAVHAAHLDPAAHPGLMVGLDTLGFDPAAVEAVRAAPQDQTALAAMDAMLAALRPNAAGDVKKTTGFLMKSLGAAYEAGADAGTISSVEAYQTAYGLAVTARDIVAAQEDAAYGDLRLELEILVRMWPGKGPSATSTPAPDLEMAQALLDIKLALARLP
jgi:hypothetical protein